MNGLKFPFYCKQSKLKELQGCIDSKREELNFESLKTTKRKDCKDPAIVDEKTSSWSH